MNRQAAENERLALSHYSYSFFSSFAPLVSFYTSFSSSLKISLSLYYSLSLFLSLSFPPSLSLALFLFFSFSLQFLFISSAPFLVISCCLFTCSFFSFYISLFHFSLSLSFFLSLSLSLIYCLFCFFLSILFFLSFFPFLSSFFSQKYLYQNQNHSFSFFFIIAKTVYSFISFYFCQWQQWQQTSFIFAGGNILLFAVGDFLRLFPKKGFR